MQNFILTTPSELKNLITEAFKEQINSTHAKGPNTQKNANLGEKLHTRLQTANLLSVTLPTLNKYVREGKIKCHRIGRRVLFKETDIINSITPKF